jgi:peptide/nickel transport system ATP-binding protein
VIASTQPLLSIQGLRTWFETPHGMVRAVESVSLDVGVGQAIGIVGESGSGKTQTFFSVFGLSRGEPGLVAGSARFAGVDLLEGLSTHVRVSGDDRAPTVVRSHPHRWEKLHQRRLERVLGREVALIFQEPRRSLVPYWTVGRHLEQVLRRRNEEPSSAGDLLDRLGFRNPARVLQAFPEELSGGEAQRVILALAMAARPRLLIADEPTTAVDPISQVRILEEIQRMYQETRPALVLISHDLAVVRRMVIQVVVMYRGRVVEQAPVGLLHDAPPESLHPYTAALRESQHRRLEGLPIVPPPPEDGPVAEPSGCPFTRQCRLRPRLGVDVQQRCRTKMPPLVQIGSSHHVACWGVQP